VNLPILDPVERATLDILPDGRIRGWHGLLFRLDLSPCLLPSHKCASCPQSAYVSVETEYRDGAILAATLRELGYAVEEHASAVSLLDYHGAVRPQRANIVIRRQNVGPSANDVGFERLPSGSYRAHVSEYDNRSTFTAEKQRQLKARYSRNLVVKQAKAKGYAVASEKVENGKIKLVLRRYS
jgi:hypothetical protein